MHGKCFFSIFHCLRGVPGGLLVSRGEEIFEILPPCLSLPRATKTNRPSLGEITTANTSLPSESLLFSDGQGFVQGTFVLSLTYCSFKMSSLCLRRLLGLAGSRLKHNHSTGFQNMIRHSGISATHWNPATCLPQEKTILGLPLNTNGTRAIRYPPFLSICTVFQPNQ